MLRPMFVTGSLVHGGAERHSITVMNRLADRGHECHAVYVKNDPSQLDRIRLRPGGSVRCLKAEHYLDAGALADFARHISRIKPSVIVAANGYALMHAALARLWSRSPAPLVATFHTTQLLGAKEQVKMLIDRPFFWHAHCSVFVCEMQKRHWLRRGLGSRENAVIYNGVDTEHFSDRSGTDTRRIWRKELGFSETDYVIGISAVLRPEKNHIQLVNAVAALRSAGIPARLLIIGDGPTRQAVEDRARELKLAADMRITGLRKDVRPYLAICDVIVLCSIAVETFSLAALESMAMGKPVIHSDLGGAAEMVFPGHNGFLFPVGDTHALVHRLSVLADPALARQMGGNARAVVETRFSEKAMVDRYESLLLDLCAGFPWSGTERVRPALPTDGEVGNAGHARSESP